MREYKVSTKTAANIMGKVNTFFKQQVMEDVGIKKVKVGEKQVTIFASGEEITYPQAIYEKRQCFNVYVGNCHVHPMQKEDYIGLATPTPLLAIADKYSDCCIPLHDGDKVIFKGNTMIVSTTGIAKGWTPRKRVFVQRNYTEEERMNHIKLSLSNLLSNYIYEDEVFSFWKDSSAARKLLYALLEQIDKAIQNVNDLNAPIAVSIDMAPLCDDLFYCDKTQCPQAQITIDARNFETSSVFDESYEYVIDEVKNNYDNMIDFIINYCNDVIKVDLEEDDNDDDYFDYDFEYADYL